jgi:hypothetical protein
LFIFFGIATFRVATFWFATFRIAVWLLAASAIRIHTSKEISQQKPLSWSWTSQVAPTCAQRFSQ